MDDTATHTPVTKRDLIEGNFGKVFQTPPQGEFNHGAFNPTNMAMMVDFAKAMSTGSQIGEHLRGNVGDCLFIVSKAIHHRLEPYSLAMMSYGVNGRMQFEAKFSVALIHASGVLKERLRYSYTGEGEERRCKVTGHFRNEETPQEYETPPLRQITPKKSPLWQTDPDQQLAYFAARAFGRRHCPEVIAGFFFEGDDDRIVDIKANPEPAEVAGLRDRLANAAAQQDAAGEKEGFSAPEAIETTLNGGAEAATSEVFPGQGGDVATLPAKRASKPAKASDDLPKKPYDGTPTAKTPAAYRKHVSQWLPLYTTEQAIEERWRSELRMRNQCNVTSEDKDKVRVLINNRINTLRNG